MSFPQIICLWIFNNACVHHNEEFSHFSQFRQWKLQKWEFLEFLRLWMRNYHALLLYHLFFLNLCDCISAHWARHSTTHFMFLFCHFVFFYCFACVCVQSPILSHQMSSLLSSDKRKKRRTIQFFRVATTMHIILFVDNVIFRSIHSSL